jgi:hypothetical protein
MARSSFHGASSQVEPNTAVSILHQIFPTRIIIGQTFFVRNRLKSLISAHRNTMGASEDPSSPFD